MDNIQEMGLIEGIKNKENQCLVELMNYYGKLVYYVASKILNNSYESEDVKDGLTLIVLKKRKEVLRGGLYP